VRETLQSSVSRCGEVELGVFWWLREYPGAFAAEPKGEYNIQGGGSKEEELWRVMSNTDAELGGGIPMSDGGMPSLRTAARRREYGPTTRRTSQSTSDAMDARKLVAVADDESTFVVADMAIFEETNVTRDSMWANLNMLSLDEEARLYTTNAERERYETQATLFGIIVALDYLEKAYVRDSVSSTESARLSRLRL
jgi:hypothetical protein